MAASSDQKISIQELGEHQLIQRYFQTQEVSEPGVVLGTGDDCAVLEGDEQHYQLISTDQLLEGIHFKKSYSSARNVGHKAAAVNLSDIAAMAGNPTGIFLSLGLPPSTPVSWVEDFTNGFRQLCSAFDVSLLGGDTTGSEDKIVIGVTIIGRVAKTNLKRRSEARPHDVVCVTGTLGDAAAGLHLLQDGREDLDQNFVHFLTEAYCSPDPAIEQGVWLGDFSEVHAMIDISDGVATDGQHICDQSKLKMKVNVDKLPFSRAFEQYTAGKTLLQNQLALDGGEDYRLLCTVEPDSYDIINSKFIDKFRASLHQIGLMQQGEADIKFFKEGQEIDPPEHTFKHF